MKIFQNKYEEEIIKSVPADDEEKVEKTEDIKQEHDEIKRPHAQDGDEPLQKKAKHEPEMVSRHFRKRFWRIYFGGL